MDLGLFENREIQASPKPDPELVSVVNEALECLTPDLREILKMRYYDGATTREIALAMHKSEKEILSLIYEARRQIRIQLAEFVSKRWGIETGKLCRICVHPKRALIETILIGKGRSESWGKTTDKIYEAVGERFHPPQILKAHLKHMNHSKERTNEQR
jgi:hypothetical protein